MTSMSFSDVAYTYKKKITRKERFLSEMNAIVPWDCLLQPIKSPRGTDGLSRQRDSGCLSDGRKSVPERKQI